MLKRTVRWINGLLALLGLSFVLTVATPLSEFLAQPLRLQARLRPAQAIVVLGGGAFRDDVPSIPSLARAVHGLSLLRAGYAPRILLSGGRASPTFGREALAMKKLLLDLGANTARIETEGRSTRTHGNAVESARILQARGIKRILLVSHPNHMLRAKQTFEKVGFTVYPAPIPWDRLPEKTKIFSLRRIRRLQSVLHEYGGLLLYWWRGWL